MSKKEILEAIKIELEGNLTVLLDPKLKDSFSSARVQTWKKLVAERIYYHLAENQNKDEEA